MRPLTITIPAWGAHYVDTAIRYTIPGVVFALEHARYQGPVRFICHTDAPDRLKRALAGYECETRRVPLVAKSNGCLALAEAHREVLREAPAGTAIALLNADIVMSRETFTFASFVFDRGQKVIASVGVRSLVGRELPPIGADARALLEWVWRNPHSITQECVWGRGRTHLPTNLFFEANGNVVLHCFHLCPVLLVKDRDLAFKGTIDDDLLANYANAEIYVPLQRECAFAELSPASKKFGLVGPLTVDFVATFGMRRFTKPHCRMFKHAIRILGDGPVDDAPAFEILRRLEHAPAVRAMRPVGPGVRVMERKA